MLDKEDVNHYVLIEQSSGCGHCIRGGEILSCLCVHVYMCVCVCVVNAFVCTGVSDCTSLWLCAWLVRRTNFPVHLFNGFLQLRQGSVRGLHSDINSGRAGRRPPPHWEGTYLFVCVYLWVCDCGLYACVRVCVCALPMMIYRTRYSLQIMCILPSPCILSEERRTRVTCQDEQTYVLTCAAHNKRSANFFRWKTFHHSPNIL